LSDPSSGYCRKILPEIADGSEPTDFSRVPALDLLRLAATNRLPPKSGSMGIIEVIA
jgi:hypothetical protein